MNPTAETNVGQNSSATSLPTTLNTHEVFVAESVEGQPLLTHWADSQTAKRAHCSKCLKIFFRFGKQRKCPDCKPPFRTCKVCGAVLTTGGSADNPYTGIKCVRVCNNCAAPTVVPALLKSLAAFERRLDSLKPGTEMYAELSQAADGMSRLVAKIRDKTAL
jgi:hypothetical protein